MHNDNLIAVDVLDVSASGMKISLVDSLSVGEHIVIMPMIMDDGSEDFEFKAEVVRVNEFEGFVGLKILSATIECFMRMVSIIMKHDGNGEKIKSEISSGGSCYAFKSSENIIHNALILQNLKT